jgi:hypothetical protein
MENVETPDLIRSTSEERGNLEIGELSCSASHSQDVL